MKKLELFRSRLTSDVQKVTEEINSLWSCIERDWNILDTDLVERENFRKGICGISYESLNSLREEQKRCAQLKKANIKVSEVDNTDYFIKIVDMFE